MSIADLLLEGTVKSSIVLALAFAAAALWRRRSAALRHWIFTSAIGCAAVMPLLGPLVPAWPIAPIGVSSLDHWVGIPAAQVGDIRRTSGEDLPRVSARRGPAADADSPAPAGGALQRAARRTLLAMQLSARAIAAVWAAGVAISLLILGVGLGRLGWIAARARPLVTGRWAESSEQLARTYRLRRPVQLLQSDHPNLLVTWGLVRPRIVLPRDATHWSRERISVVLAHELAHVERGDWAIQMLAELVRTAYWFNPLVWLACTRLRQESEQATDDAVLGHGIAGSEYATHLIDLARALTNHRRRAWLPAAAVARPSSLERRVRAMLNESTNRAPAPRALRFATVAAALLLSAALAAAQAAFSTFSGTVFDEQNGFIPGAKLVLTNPQNQSKYEVVTDRTGHYEFVGLPPGDYALETSVMGFAPLRGTVTLRGENAQRDLVLQLGSLQETITVSGPGTAPSPARRPGYSKPARRPDPACSGVPAGGMGGNIRAPHKLVDVKPIYPQQLYDARIGGTVVLLAQIDTEGRVSSVDVVSSAHPDLSAAAIDAVRQWEFDSTILNCTKVEVPMTVNVTFSPR
jgi:TonB family protein